MMVVCDILQSCEQEVANELADVIRMNGLLSDSLSNGQDLRECDLLNLLC